MSERRRPRKRSPRTMVLLLALAAVVLPGIYPVRDYLAARRDIAELRRANAIAEKRVASLQRQLERLKTDAEVERLAREELGMVRPGERSFVVVDPPKRRIRPR